jgi:hypothetical protein
MLGFLKKFFSMFEGRKTLYLPVLTIGEKSKYTGYTYPLSTVREASNKCNATIMKCDKVFLEVEPDEKAALEVRANKICGECLKTEVKNNKLYGKFVFYNTDNGNLAINLIRNKKMEVSTASLVKIVHSPGNEELFVDEMDIFKFNLRPYKA